LRIVVSAWSLEADHGLAEPGSAPCAIADSKKSTTTNQQPTTSNQTTKHPANVAARLAIPADPIHLRPGFALSCRHNQLE